MLDAAAPAVVPSPPLPPTGTLQLAMKCLRPAGRPRPATALAHRA